MRCPKCGSIAHHLITDTNGDCLYECTAGLTPREKTKEDIFRAGRISPCDTIVDADGKIFVGSKVYVTNNELRVFKA